MSAQGDGPTRPPRAPDFRWARRLFLIGVAVALVSLVVLAVSRGSGEPGPHASPTGAPSSGGTPTPGGPSSGPPLDSFPGETAEEYRWRAEADDLRQQARGVLQDLLDQGDPAADPALRAQLERAADLLEHEAQADALRQEARAADLGSSAPEPANGRSGAGGVTSAVALIGGVGGMLTAAAGLLTAWVSWRKAARAG